MIYKESYLQVADNSGAQLVKCIKILGSNKKSNYARVGDSILVSVIQVSTRSGKKSKQVTKSDSSIVKKGHIYKALVIRTKKARSNYGNSSFFYGQRISFQENYVVLINHQGNPMGSRIFGPMSREIRANKFNKLMSQSKGVL